MEIEFKSNKLKKQLTVPKESFKSFGTRAKKVVQRMKEVIASETLADLQCLPSAGCHALSGDMKGEWALKISPNHRLLFEPWHDPMPERDDGGLDTTKVTTVRMLREEDYH